MNGDTPVVRRAKASDAAAIAALQVRSWQAAYRGIVPDAFLDDLTEDAWRERWTDQLAAAGREGSINSSRPTLGTDHHAPSQLAVPRWSRRPN